MLIPTKYNVATDFVKHRGIFSFSELLQGIRKWYVDDDYEFHIIAHKFKIPSPLGAEHEIEIHGEKKVTDYVRYHIDIFMKFYDVRDVELIKDGQKLKMNDGKLLIEIKCDLEFDWQQRFGGSKFLQALHDFYRNYIIKYKIKDYWEDILLLKMGELKRVIKEKIGLEVVI
jgi:hypothetical protein